MRSRSPSLSRCLLDVDAIHIGISEEPTFVALELRTAFREALAPGGQIGNAQRHTPTAPPEVEEFRGTSAPLDAILLQAGKSKLLSFVP